MKRLSLVLLPLVFSLFLAGCGEKAPSDATAAGAQPAPAASPTGSSASPDDIYMEAIKNRDGGNHEKAFELFKQATDLGIPCAPFFVGMAYENGEGRSPDAAQAMEWYKKSSAAGCVEASKRIKILEGKK